MHMHKIYFKQIKLQTYLPAGWIEYFLIKCMQFSKTFIIGVFGDLKIQGDISMEAI